MSITKGDAVKATVYTPRFKVEGFIHLLFRDSYRGRLSDHLNSDRMPTFIPITEARVDELDSKKSYDCTCIIINRNLIEAVIESKE